MIRHAHQLFALLLMPLGVATAQVTLVVPTNHATIQAAIVAASPGDTLLVLPGTYVENINFLGKAVTVRSSAGAAVTTINGNQIGPVVTFTSSETIASALEGFTITNGRGLSSLSIIGQGGGIQCVGASPTVRRCHVTGNFGADGLEVSSAFVSDGGAGGVTAISSGLRLIDCDITANVGGRGGVGATVIVGGGGRGGPGGAILTSFSGQILTELQRCRFLGNRGGDGGGLATIFEGPMGGAGGCGGIEVVARYSVQLTDCEIAGNSGGSGGTAAVGLNVNAGAGGNGGFDLRAGSTLPSVVTMVNCVVVNNAAGNGGVGSNSRGGDGAGSTGAITFSADCCTLAGNTSGAPMPTGVVCGGVTFGGPAVSSQMPSAVLRNCILWGNSRGGLPSDMSANGISVSMDTSDVGVSTATTIGTGNLSVDPLFVNLVAGDVHLSSQSPCRHVGSVVATLPLFDLDGDPRVIGPGIDMGADEFEALPGSREDLVLSLSVNGSFAPSVLATPAVAGDTLDVSLTSPSATMSDTFAVVLIEPWLPPISPQGPGALPSLHLPFGATWLAAYPLGVGATGAAITAALPFGLTGFSFRLQALTVTPTAKNGLFAATAARDLVL